MDFYAIQGAITDGVEFTDMNLSRNDLTILDYSHLSAILGGQAYSHWGSTLPPHAKRDILMPERVFWNFFQQMPSIAYTPHYCGVHEGRDIGDWVVYAYPQGTYNFRGMGACLILLDYDLSELLYCLDTGSFSGNGPTPIALHCADSTSNTQFVNQYTGQLIPVGAGTLIQNNWSPAPIPPSDDSWFTGTREIAADIFLEGHNKRSYSPSERLTDKTRCPGQIRYTVSRGDGTLLDNYYLDLKNKQIQLFSSYVDETVLTLFLCSTDDATKDKDYYFYESDDYNNARAQFKPAYNTYNLQDPASLDTICRAAEELIEARSKALYQTKAEGVMGQPQAQGYNLIMGTQAAQAAYGVPSVSNTSNGSVSGGRTYQYTLDPPVNGVNPLTPLLTKLPGQQVFYKYNIRMVENDYQNPLGNPQ